MLMGRPEINKENGSRIFKEFYYTEEELAGFCKENGLNIMGSKNELIERISEFLDGKKTEEKFILKRQADEDVIYDDTQIGIDFQFGEKQADYFNRIIGAEFIPYEDFIIWMEVNPGKTYEDAVRFWFLMHDHIVTGG